MAVTPEFISPSFFHLGVHEMQILEYEIPTCECLVGIHEVGSTDISRPCFVLAHGSVSLLSPIGALYMYAGKPNNIGGSSLAPV